MSKLDVWKATFENNLRVIKSKVNTYLKELNEYDLMIPSDRSHHRKRILELRNKVNFYDDIISKYEDENYSISEELIGDILVSGDVDSNELVETEFGDFAVSYKKSKDELIDEYYKIIQNLNNLKRTDRSHTMKYKVLAEQLYFKYALLIDKAPLIRTGKVKNEIIDAGDEKQYQLHVNQYNILKRLAANLDERKESLISKVHMLEEQYMNYSNRNSIEKNELKVTIAGLKSDIANLKSNKNKYEILAEESLIRLQTVKGVIKRDYCAYLISKLDADDRVERELSNIEVFKYDIEKNDAELRLLALSDNPDEKKRQELLVLGAALEKMRDNAFKDLSEARRRRLKQEILHAYNVGSISLSEKNKRLYQLKSYIIVNPSVEKEVSLYLTEDEKPIEDNNLKLG
jgi:hypothetical protein